MKSVKRGDQIKVYEVEKWWWWRLYHTCSNSSHYALARESCCEIRSEVQTEIQIPIKNFNLHLFPF